MGKSGNNSKVRLAGYILLGLILFASSMSFLFNFQSIKEVEGVQQDFVTVKDGMFYYLDNKGYNFKFQLEINQVLITESEQYISDKEITIISDNSFGTTTLMFDLLEDGKVKFTIDHQGNMKRNYWFRMNIYDLDFKSFKDSIFVWDSGYFDYSDMKQEETFRIERLSDRYWFSVEFEDTQNFWIDPLLSKEIYETVPVSGANDYKVNNSVFWSDSDLLGRWRLEQFPNRTYTDPTWGLIWGGAVRNGDLEEVLNSPGYGWTWNNMAWSPWGYNHTPMYHSAVGYSVPRRAGGFTNNDDRWLEQDLQVNVSLRRVTFWTSSSPPGTPSGMFRVTFVDGTTEEMDWTASGSSSGGTDHVFVDIDFDVNISVANRLKKVDKIRIARPNNSYTQNFYIDDISAEPRDIADGTGGVSSGVANILDYSSNGYNGTWNWYQSNGTGWNYQPATTWNHPSNVIPSSDYDAYQGWTRFDETTEYYMIGNWSMAQGVNLGDNDAFSFTSAGTDQPFSIAGFVRVEDVITYPSGTLLAKANGTSGATSGFEYAMMINDRKLQFNIYDGGSDSYMWVNSSTLYLDNKTWLSLAYTYDGSELSSGMKIYADGIDVTQNSGDVGGYTGMQNTNSNLSIGSFWNSMTNSFLEASIDEVTLWSKELNVSAVNYIFNNTDTVVISISADKYGFLINASSQVQYKINYTIADPAPGNWSNHNHQFYVSHNYSFVNVTLGNGTVKTVEEGFSITPFNSSHDLVSFILLDNNGTFTWFFMTPNAIVYMDIDPRVEDGQQTNITTINYNIQVANGSNGIINYPVLIEVKTPQDTVLASEQKLTGSNGWLNSSITSNWAMTSNKRIYLSATGINQSFLGYEVEYFTSYQDLNAPIIQSVNFDITVIESNDFVFQIFIDDDFTVNSDLTVYFYYSVISSGALSQFYIMEYQSGEEWKLTIAGKAAETTLWFQIRIWDNLSNFVQTSIYSTQWIVPPAGEPASPSGDGNGAPPAAAASATGGGSLTFLLFFAGAIMVAVLGYAIFRTTRVRTRRVETREVTTGFGRFGRTTERIEEKGD